MRARSRTPPTETTAQTPSPARTPPQAPAQPLAQRLFAQLADGRFHSGSELAQSANVTRSAVWKAMRQLRAMGAEVQAVTHRGYRLEVATVALDVDKIRHLLGTSADNIDLEVAWSVASTNLALLAAAPPRAGDVQALLAEHQSAGRGRRGRQWLAPLGGGLCLSLATSFVELPTDVSSLSLAMGVCALRALKRLSVTSAMLKWPNDVVTAAGKLGGILIELRAESGGPAHVVVGIGLNVDLSNPVQAAVQATGTVAADLASLASAPLDRNRVAALLIEECAQGLRIFSQAGFVPFMAQWSAADALRDCEVAVSGAGAVRSGIARGIDARGALLLEADSTLVPIVAGEVSVRTVA